MKGMLLLLVSASAAHGWTLVGPQVSGWSARTLAVYVNTTNCTLSADVVNAEVDRAIAIWNRVPTSRLTIVRSPTPSTQGAAQFNAGTATELPLVLCETNFDSAVGSADFVPAATLITNIGNGPMTRAAIYLNAQTGAGAEISRLPIESFRIALTHEMGHMLGLGHSSASEALMYFSVSGKSTARLTEDDRMGIDWLYPRNELAAGAFGCSAVHGSGTPWALVSALAYLAALFAIGRRFGVFQSQRR